jgi:hypothetical protein
MLYHTIIVTYRNAGCGSGTEREWTLSSAMPPPKKSAPR